MSGNVIARPGVTGRLGAALNSGSLLMVAPAGAGKTMALEAALAVRPGNVARVRCLASDADPGRLIGHLVEAVRRALPGAADVLGEMLAGPGGDISPDAVAADLVAELERLVVDPLTIVFDDAEHLADDERAAAIIGALMASESAALRVVVASRRDLPLRLAKLRTSGRVTVVDQSLLSFTASECEDLLRGDDATVTERDVRAAMELTEGWPLGLAVLVGARRAGSAPAAGLRSTSELSLFLEEEVLDGLEPGFRHDLLVSSLAPELTPATAAALGLAGDFVESARARDLFLRPVAGGDGRRFAYHPLFREFLAERLANESDEAALAPRRAALAAEICGERPVEAVEHWLTAGDEAAAVAFLGSHSQPLVRSSPTVLGGWLEQLSPASRTTPALQLVDGQLAMGDGRPETAADLLAAAAHAWEARGSRAAWTARLSLAQTLIVLGRFDEIPPLVDGLEAPGARNAVPAPMVAMMAALGTSGSGRQQESEALIDRAMAHPLAALVQPYREMFRHYWRHLVGGRFDAATEVARAGIAAAEEYDPMRFLPYTYWYAAYAEEARGDIAGAVALLERSRAAFVGLGLGAFPAAVVTALKAGCDARAGRLAAAEVELARAGNRLDRSWFAYDVEVTRAELAARRGDAASVLAAAENAMAMVADGFLVERLRAPALLARPLAATGATSRARELIDATLAACPAHVRAPRLLALRGWLRDLDGDPGAPADVRTAWELAGGQVRYLARAEWPRIEALVWQAVGTGELQPEVVVTAVHAAFPDGDALVELLDHPDPGVRHVAAATVATSGHPDAAGRLARLGADADPDVALAAERAARRLASDPPALAFTLLGGFRVRRAGREVAEHEWERRVAARLVRFLLVHCDESVPEELLFEAFWPGRQLDSARRNLQVAVSAARGVLDSPGVKASRLEARDRAYRLVLRPSDTVDADDFDAAASSALALVGAGRGPALRRAAALWHGDPLPEERYEDWCTVWRQRLLDRFAELLEGVAADCLADGDAFGATAAAQRLVALDPLNEAAHRTLMVAFARSGRRGHALRQFLDCRRTLVDELGVEPAEQTAALQRSVLAGLPV